MCNHELQQRVKALFTYAIREAGNIPALQQELRASYQRLQQPMRVAIVGKIKAGKSTFMNALLEEHVVETGAVETTFNVNWLRYGQQRTLTIHYKDEKRPPDSTTYEQLGQLTRRSDDPKALSYLRSIKYVQVSYPNDILRSFDLIDTPGLESAYEDDAKNTLDFLLRYGKELTAATQEETTKADAVIYLFAKGLAETDDATLKEFRGDVIGQARPFNAIGVLTKADMNWKAYADPIQGVREITRRLAGSFQGRRLFYTILPVAGLLGFGAKTLTGEEFATMLQVAELPAERFQRLIQLVSGFTKDRPDIAIPGEKRQQLIRRLGQYGVNLAYKLMNEQGICDHTALSAALYERSGLAAVRELIRSHFGNRAYLIKLQAELQRLEIAFIKCRQGVQGHDREMVEDIAGKFQMLKLQEQSFQEVEILGSYYENKLAFTRQEGEELLQVTGEYGATYHDLLGMPRNASMEELKWAAQSRLAYWKARAIDFGYDRATLRATNVVVQSYNRIAYELSQVA